MSAYNHYDCRRTMGTVTDLSPAVSYTKLRKDLLLMEKAVVLNGSPSNVPYDKVPD